jgi:hypothetical protein
VRRFLDDIGWRGFLMFEIYVGGLIISPLLHTLFLISLSIGWSGGHGIRTVWDAGYIGILVLGYGAAFVLTVAGLMRARKAALIPYQLLLPIYWLLHAIATVRAAYELLTRPYFWAKTPHGRTRMTRR